MGQALNWHGLKSEEWEQIGADNRRFVASMCRKHGEIGRPMAVDYLHRSREDSVKANQRLRALSEALEMGKTGLTATVHDGELKKWCKRHAEEIEMVCEQWTKRAGVDEAIRYARKRVEDCGLVFPIADPDNATREEWGHAMARVFDPRWWRLQARRIQARKIEAVAREIRLVHKDAGIYSSDVTVKRRKGQKRRNYDALTAMEAVNEDGEAVNLAELVKSSVSNPVNRRAELMVRIKGFEQCADAAGHVGVFITLTAPSKYHRMTYIKSMDRALPNRKYKGFDPRETQAYFCRLWSQIRAQLWREEIRPYGFRVAEPHHDGTPHWHMLLFVDKEQAERLRAVIEDYGIREDGKEWGAARQRVKIVNIDPEKGSAAGYIAKYVAKNIDGHGLEEDLYGQPADSSAARIDAWASAWRIRQFQQIGGASVTVWRELRRLKLDDIASDEETSVEVIKAFLAADSSDWAAYTMIQGGMTVRREDQLIRSNYEDNGKGRYYQPVKRLVGLVARGFGDLATRLTQWVIQRAGTADKQAERLEAMERENAYPRGSSLEELEDIGQPMTLEELQALDAGPFCGAGTAPPWTRGNNCTAVQGLHEPEPPGGGSITGKAGAMGV